jgi:hypothetical protein
LLELRAFADTRLPLAGIAAVWDNALMAATPSPERRIRLIRPPDADGVGVFAIFQDRQTAFYTVREIPCDVGGRGFEVHRLGLGSLYHVRVGEPRECSCECLGFLSHRRCRHILGLRALIERGKI